MLMPKKTKYRKVQKGKMRGYARKGSGKVTFGEYGLAAVEPGWLTARQIEAARVALVHEVKLKSSNLTSNPELMRLDPALVVVQSYISLEGGHIGRGRLEGNDPASLSDNTGLNERVVSDVGAYFENRHAGFDFFLRLVGALNFMHAGKEEFL